jgi:hypothetical protein
MITTEKVEAEGTRYATKSERNGIWDNAREIKGKEALDTTQRSSQPPCQVAATWTDVPHWRSKLEIIIGPFLNFWKIS